MRNPHLLHRYAGWCRRQASTTNCMHWLTGTILGLFIIGLVIYHFRVVVEQVLIITGIALSAGGAAAILCWATPPAWRYFRKPQAVPAPAARLAWDDSEPPRAPVPEAYDNEGPRDEDLDAELARVLTQTGQWQIEDQL